MSENLRNYLSAIIGLEGVIRSVPASAWDNPSPCEGWQARDVAGHAMAVVNNVAASAGFGDRLDPFAEQPRVHAGADPAEAWRAIRNRFLRAVDQQGALQTIVSTSFGEITLDRYIGVLMADALIHTWDIARATGGDERLDPDLVPLAHASLVARGDGIRVPGRYGSATDVGDVDPQTALIAYTGRMP